MIPDSYRLATVRGAIPGNGEPDCGISLDVSGEVHRFRLTPEAARFLVEVLGRYYRLTPNACQSSSWSGMPSLEGSPVLEGQ